jgi:hypothetical protein
MKRSMLVALLGSARRIQHLCSGSG